MKCRSQVISFYPITIINDIEIFGYRKGRLCIYNNQNESTEYFCKLNISFFDFLFFRINILSRIFRLVNATGVKSNNNIIFALKGNVWNFDLVSKKLTHVVKLTHGSRPLKFILVSENSNFKSGIYFGEYFDNPDMGVVHIYRLTIDKLVLETVYSFTSGEINHIHSLVEDKPNDCIWILTGDFENAAGIYMARNNFSTVELILGGQQDFRSCVACPVADGLLYATDTPFTQNTVRLLNKKNEEWFSTLLFEINGSVIYGYENEKYLFISTTVESNGIYRNLIEAVFSRKKGDGIKDYFSYVYIIDRQTFEYQIIYKVKKDIFPFVLFQFGSIVFPSGCWNRNVIPLFHIATEKFNLNTLFLEY